MSAGESAYDVARRQREKAERLQNSAALWEKGAQGEVAVAHALEALPEGWVVLHDLAWPGRPKANIDHVVIGPGGVFVVDSKNWSGTVEVRGQVLRQNGRQREQAVVSAADAATALQRVVPVSQPCVGVLCFVGDNVLSGSVRDVMICSTSNLVTMLTSRPVALDPAEVEACARAVRSLAERTVVGEAIARTVSKPRSASGARAQRASQRRRLNVVKALVALTFLAVLVSGGLTKVIAWGADQLVQIVQTEPAPPPPSPKDEEVEKRTTKDAPSKTKQGR